MSNAERRLKHVRGADARRHSDSPAAWAHLVALSALLLVLCLPATGLGQQVPERFRGIWASEECVRAERVRVVNEVGVLDLVPLQGVLHIQVATFRDRPTVPADGMTMTGWMTVPGPGQAMEKEFWLDDGRLDGLFVSCPGIPPTAALGFGEGLAAFVALGDVVRQCELDPGRSCVLAAFDFVDINGDDRLSPAELSRLFRIAGFFIGYGMKERALLPVGELIVPVAIAGTIAPMVSQGLLANFDYDNDGMLSVEEVLQDRGDAATLLSVMDAVQPVGAEVALRGVLATLQPLLSLIGSFLR